MATTPKIPKIVLAVGGDPQQCEDRFIEDGEQTLRAFLAGEVVAPLAAFCLDAPLDERFLDRRLRNLLVEFVALAGVPAERPLFLIPGRPLPARGAGPGSDGRTAARSAETATPVPASGGVSPAAGPTARPAAGSLRSTPSTSRCRCRPIYSTWSPMRPRASTATKSGRCSAMPRSASTARPRHSRPMPNGSVIWSAS